MREGSYRETAGIPSSGGTNSFFQEREGVAHDEETIEAVTLEFNRAMALITQPRTYCKIQGVVGLTEAFFLNEKRVNFILLSGKDPFEAIYKKIKPAFLYILRGSYTLRPQEHAQLETALSRIAQYLGDRDRNLLTDLLRTKGLAVDKPVSHRLADALSEARALRVALDQGMEPRPPRHVTSPDEMQSLVRLFHSSEVMGADSVGLLFELLRVVASAGEGPFLRDFWNGDERLFTGFVIQNLEWCLHKASEVATQVREASGVLGQLLPLLGPLLQRSGEQTTALLLRSFRDFRIKLVKHGHLEESDQLY